MPGSPSMASIPIFLHFIVLSLLLLLPPPSAAAQTTINMTLGSSLTPLGQTTSAVSPSGDFAVGFRSLESNSSLFLLAVWFARAPDQTVVWAANRNNPVPPGSKLELASDGRLALSDHAGQEIWSAGASSSNITHAAMLDSGNFVLVSSTAAAYAWESFGEPMDTILPSQVLQLGPRLTSRLMESDYSDGRFQLRVQDDGNLVFYTSAALSCPSGIDCAPYDAYWSSSTVGAGERLVFSSAGDAFFALKNGSTVSLTSAKGYSPGAFYHRVTLDPDGVLRHYVFPRNGTGGGRRGGEWTAAASLPSDICIRIRSFVGSGVCGLNSYCSADPTTQKLLCECPPQYSFVDPGRKYKGCKPDFAPQSCEGGSGAGAPAGGFRVEKMPGMDWPSCDYERLQPVNEEQCGAACLNDCFCAAAVHRNDVCWKKRLPLSNGRLDMGFVGKALLKVPTDANSTKSISTPPSPNSPFTRERRERTWLLVLLGGANCLLLAAVFLLACCFYRKKMYTRVQPDQSTMLGTSLRSFAYKELEDATQAFEEEVGRGAFGVVYKGVIESDSSSTFIAVKQLRDLDEAVEEEFEKELRIINQTHHKNLARLLGYCNEGPRRLLVYEYMSNGSLFDFLLGSTKTAWNTRVQIAFGVARGLLYLHEECSTQIIHCDIKPQNILIDDHFHARISDFGLAKLLRTDQTRTHTGIRGTRGYVAPEWFKHIAITAKVDVYSFGVLLLEIICCRRNVEPEVEEEKTVLAYWAYDCFRAGRLDMLVENEEEPLADARRLERLVMVAIWCIQEEPSLRPTMRKVTQMLEGAVDAAFPPDPSSYSSSIN